MQAASLRDMHRNAVTNSAAPEFRSAALRRSIYSIVLLPTFDRSLSTFAVVYAFTAK
jgi:hypothetical protein